MGILDRLKMLAKSNLNDLTSSNDPRRQYDAALRDMDDSLREAKEHLATSRADERRATQDADRRREEVLRWESRAEAAVRAGDDVLAREALIQKRRAEDEERELRRIAATHRAALEELQAGVSQLEIRLQDARARTATATARSYHPGAARSADYPRQSEVPPLRPPQTSALDDRRNFDEFDRQARSVDEFDAYAEAMRELDRDPDQEALEARFRALEQDQGGVSQELDSLKEKLAKR